MKWTFKLLNFELEILNLKKKIWTNEMKKRACSRIEKKNARFSCDGTYRTSYEILRYKAMLKQTSLHSEIMKRWGIVQNILKFRTVQNYIEKIFFNIFLTYFLHRFFDIFYIYTVYIAEKRRLCYIIIKI